MPEMSAGERLKTIVDNLTPYEFEVKDTEALNIANKIKALDTEAETFKKTQIDKLLKQLAVHKAEFDVLSAQREALKCKLFFQIENTQTEDWNKIGEDNDSHFELRDDKVFIVKGKKSKDDDEDAESSSAVIHGVKIELPKFVAELPSKMKEALINDIKEHIGPKAIEAIKAMRKNAG